MPTSVTNMSINGLAINGTPSPTCVVGAINFVLTGTFPTTITPSGVAFAFQDGPDLVASSIDRTNSTDTKLLGQFDYPPPGLGPLTLRISKLSVTVTPPGGTPTAPFPPLPGGLVFVPASGLAEEADRP